jgi:hypothetical protein
VPPLEAAAAPAVDDRPPRGLTVEDVARRYRVSPDKVRRWLSTGELMGINTSTSLAARPRWVISQASLLEFEKRRCSAPPPKPSCRPRRRTGLVDFYPD